MIVRPMLATSAECLPLGPDWTYEVKWDGYRALAVKDARGVRLLSRNQKDLTRDYPTVAAAVSALSTRDVILDGEIVAVDAAGHPSFQALQHRALTGLTIVYYAFDLLQLNSESLVERRLDERRRRLAAVVKGSYVLLRYRRLHAVRVHGATRGERASGEAAETGGPT